MEPNGRRRGPDLWGIPGSLVDFHTGARDGRFESNTWTLEKKLGWSGLLIEAGRDYIDGLRQMRACRVAGSVWILPRLASRKPWHKVYVDHVLDARRGREYP